MYERDDEALAVVLQCIASASALLASTLDVPSALAELANVLVPAHAEGLAVLLDDQTPPPLIAGQIVPGKVVEFPLIVRGTRLGVLQVARSRPFWAHYYPALQRSFADQLGPVPLDVFYRAINKVARSLIRTDADEVTYNLHIMLRFDLELRLLEGRVGGGRHIPGIHQGETMVKIVHQ